MARSASTGACQERIRALRGLGGRAASVSFTIASVKVSLHVHRRRKWGRVTSCRAGGCRVAAIYPPGNVRRRRRDSRPAHPAGLPGPPRGFASGPCFASGSVHAALGPVSRAEREPDRHHRSGAMVMRKERKIRQRLLAIRRAGSLADRRDALPFRTARRRDTLLEYVLSLRGQNLARGAPASFSRGCV